MCKSVNILVFRSYQCCPGALKECYRFKICFLGKTANLKFDLSLLACWFMVFVVGVCRLNTPSNLSLFCQIVAE